MLIRLCSLSLFFLGLILLLSPRLNSASPKKLSSSDLDRLEAEWLDDEQQSEDESNFKYGRDPNNPNVRTPPPPQAPTYKTEMIFLTISWAKPLPTSPVQMIPPTESMKEKELDLYATRLSDVSYMTIIYLEPSHPSCSSYSLIPLIISMLSFVNFAY
jgi:hypothetical protein